MQYIYFQTAPPPSGPKFPYNGSLLASVDQNTDRTKLQCVTEARPGDRFKWFRNGIQLNNTESDLVVMRSDMGSGFYCCEIYSNTSTADNVVFDTHCATLVFRSKSI